jgi:hypothetical protein
MACHRWLRLWMGGLVLRAADAYQRLGTPHAHPKRPLDPYRRTAIRNATVRQVLRFQQVYPAVDCSTACNYARKIGIGVIAQ